jgi:nitric oxide reductase large subunit
MNRGQRDKSLKNFFAAYFNQDWTMDGAKSWQDVIEQFVKENGAADSRLLRQDLASWIGETAVAQQKNLPAEFGCDFDSASVGLTERQWVEQIVAEFDRLLAQRT